LGSLRAGTSLDILAHVKENNWQGRCSAELEIIDSKKTA